MLSITIVWVFENAANFMMFIRKRPKKKLIYIYLNFKKKPVAQRACLIRLIILLESNSSSFLVF